VISERRRIPVVSVGLAAGAILFASLMLSVRASATPHMDATGREPEVLQDEVVRLFEELDEVERLIEGVRAEMESARSRISELAGEIDARQELLNRRAAEAYMSGQAVGVDSLLGASSFTELQDSLEYLDAVSQRDHDLLLALQHRKREVELQALRLEALDGELREKRQGLEATAALLVEKLQRQLALRQRADEAAPDVGSLDPSASTPPPSPPAPSAVLSREAVIELIRDQFSSLGTGAVEKAQCVAERESSLDPLAENPTTGAAGLFQFLPSTWETLSESAGRGGASVFDAGANAAVAAWTVAEYGWHPWRSVASDC
jgi:DNA repair exonuclease SbcCD ATPase subunit